MKYLDALKNVLLPKYLNFAAHDFDSGLRVSLCARCLHARPLNNKVVSRDLNVQSVFDKKCME